MLRWLFRPKKVWLVIYMGECSGPVRPTMPIEAFSRQSDAEAYVAKWQPRHREGVNLYVREMDLDRDGSRLEGLYQKHISGSDHAALANG